MLVLVTLGAPQRRLLDRRRKRREAAPEPDPTPVATARATVIDVGAPLEALDQARAWLTGAGEDYLAGGLAVLNRALHAFRLVTANPFVNAIAREQALVARVGYGAGEQVADGLWADALELELAAPRQRRIRALHPQARLAAVLGGRERALAAQELTLRARLDLDAGREREAALQLLVALDAALAELAVDATAPALAERLAELGDFRDALARAAQTALAGPLGPADLETVSATLGRVEAALRARLAELS